MKILNFIILLILMSACFKSEQTFNAVILSESEFQAKLYDKEVKNNSKPVLIIVPGSGGSYINEKYFYDLVNENFPILSIAYFGQPRLSKELEKIPLEYLDSVVRWVRRNYQNRKIILIGISKGAEYGLLYESKFNALDGLICYAPTSIIIPNHVKVPKQEKMKSSWTFKDKEISFAKLKYFNSPAGKVVYKDYIEPLLDNGFEYEKSKINVENIKCPILLLSGKEDLVWPSARMSSLLTNRILKYNPNAKIKNISYENCGHQFFWLNKEIPTKYSESQSLRINGIKKHRFLYGGTKQGTINAMIKSRNDLMTFLKNF